jgi:hypothetical protein
MAIYEVDAPNGKTYEVEGPPGVDHNTIVQQILARHPEAGVARTIAGQAKEALKAIPRGLIGGLETAAVGASALLPEGMEKAVAGKAHELAKRFAPQAAPGYEETIPTRLAEGVGSMGSFLIPGGLPARAAMAGAMGAGEARQRAQQAGATPEETSSATAYGILPGLTDLLPIERIMGRFGVSPIKGISDRLISASKTGSLEAVQETAQSIAQNMIEQGLYNPEKDPIEGAAEAGGYGFGVGALVQSMVDLVMPNRGRVRPTRPPVAEEPPVAPPTPEAPPVAPVAEEPPVAPPVPEVPTAPKVTAAAPVTQETSAAPKTDVAAETPMTFVAPEGVATKEKAKEKAKVATTTIPEIVPVAPAQPGVITDDVLKSLEIKGYGQKKLKDAIRGLDLNTDEGRVAFTAAFENAPKGIKYNSAAVEVLSPTVKVEEPPLELRTPIQPESGQPARSDAVPVPAGTTAVTPSEVVGTPGVGSDIAAATGAAEGEKPVSAPLTAEEAADQVDQEADAAEAAAKPAPRIAPKSKKAAAEVLAVKDAPKEVQEYVQFYGDMDTALKALGFDLYEKIPAGENFERQGGQYAKQFGEWVETNGTPEQKKQLAKSIETAKRNKTAAKEFYARWTKQQKAKKALAAELEQSQRDEFVTRQKATAKQRAEDRAGEAELELIGLGEEVDQDEARRAAMRLSTGEKTGRKENTVEDVREELQREFKDKKGFDNLVTVVQSEKELPRRILDHAEYGEAIRGVVYDGRVWLVADNIPRGQELSVALHEVGAHVGFDRLMSQKERKKLSDQVRTWATENNMRGEAARIALGKGKESNDEIIAYMTEELVNRGVRPTSFRPASQWLKRVFDKFKAFLEKLGVGTLTEQNLVDMAYGAAHIAIRLPVNVQYGKPRFSVSNPGLAAAVDTANDYFKGPPAPQGVISSAIESVTSPNRFQRTGNTIDKIRQNMANKNTWWEDWFASLHGNNALDAMGAASALDKLQSSTKVSGISAATLEMGGFRKNEKTGLWEAYKTDASYKDILEELQKMVGKYSETPDFQTAERLFDLAATARREEGLINSKQLTTQGGTVAPTLNAKQLKVGLAAYHSTPEIRKALNLYEKFKNRGLDSLVTAGVLDQETVDGLKKNAGYVPWFRFSENEDGSINIKAVKEFSKGLVNRSKMQELKGGRVEDIEINNVLDNMAKLSNWMVNKSVGNDTAKYLTNFALRYNEARKVGSPVATGVDPKLVAQVMVDGKEEYYAFKDPAALPAFKGYESAHWAITPFFAAPANLLRRGITLNPVFSLAQLPQDAIRAFTSSGLKNPYAIFPRVLANFTKELFGTTETAQRLKQFGIIGKGSDIMPGEAKRSFRRKLGYYDAGMGGLFNRGIDVLERISAASDEAVRTALYELTMKETGNEVLALRRAREIINFDTMGSSAYASFLRQTVPFMGVWMNDMNNLYKGLVLGSARLSEGEKAATKRAIVYRGTQLAVLTMLYTMMVGDEDDYKKLDDNKRNRSFVVPNTTFRIPVPNDGIGFLFKVIPEQITRTVLAEGVEGEDAGSRAGRAIAGAFWDLGSFENFLIPGGALPKLGVELSLNRSFFTQNPIVGKSKEFLVPSQQYTDSTTEISKQLGAALNLSPLKLDYLLRGIGGQIGGAVLSMSNALFHAAEGKVTPSLRYEDISVLSPFSYSTKDKGAKEDYYEMRNRIDMVARTYRDLVSAGKGEEALSYITDPENRQAYALRQLQTRIDEDMSKFRKVRKLILDNKNIDEDEMRRQLDELEAKENKYLESLRLPKLRAAAGIVPDITPNFLKALK